MQNWLIKFFRNPVGIGSVAASSRSLGRLVARDITPEMAVLELGPGSGALTSHVLAKLKTPQQLTLVESDEEFVRVCTERFPDSDVRHMDAEILLKNSPGRYDAIVSGIPFAALPAKTRQRMFQEVKNALKPGGIFVMFQYSLTSKNELKELFGNVTTRFTPWNIPPAFAYTCEKQD